VGNETLFDYDALNRLITAVDPSGNQTLTEYDSVDNPVRITDRNGRVRTFAYDGADRLVLETWLDGTTIVNEIQSAHDGAGNLTGISDATGTLAYTYNLLNQVTAAGNGGTPLVPELDLSYQYDANGNVTSVTDSLGILRQASYDVRNRLQRLDWSPAESDPVRLEFEYGACCGLMGMTRSIGAGTPQKVGTTSYTRDASSHVTGMTHAIQAPGSPTSTIASQYAYTYDPTGRLTRESHHGQDFTYGYDLLGQIIGSTREIFGPETFQYDANGNRNGPGYTVGTGNRILADAVFDYGYDAEGNLVLKTDRATGASTTYSYDHRNRLTSAEERSVTSTLVNEAHYGYDPRDRRILSSVNGRILRHVYDRDNVWADFDQDSSLETSYLFGDEIDAILARSKPGQEAVWYLKDRLGTVRDLADSSGGVINHIDYDSFGGLIAQTHPDQGDRFLFTGREYEPALGIYYYRARYYNPDLGRFMNEDPLAFDANDMNLYRYVINCPTTGKDPYGNEAIFDYALLNSMYPIMACRIAVVIFKVGIIFLGISYFFESGGSGTLAGTFGGIGGGLGIMFSCFH
jgi:RHS repeat-associated protein